MEPPPQAVMRERAMSKLPSLYARSFATRFASLGGEPPRASWLARVRFRHFPSGRLPRRCHLPACSIATSPLWLKTVTCGLFLRCFTPPRRAPKGGRLFIRLFFTVISTDLVGNERPRPPALTEYKCHFDRSEDDSLNAAEKSPTEKVFRS